nr:immunoglobulin heavy chain junction region [Macaca mulatta]MOV54357.1 immunoglobulin heavy chain junction region [Macaca mulatta]MOV55680.1 immunoglobulin heavy chain junction region [Macaca mulatta]MOV59950.1 immunoglobulin heavy chain junction region [Macaca mulatta]MOV60830.1 immunoglobulin heavy chain junction region [Macaca mulatta]
CARHYIGATEWGDAFDFW